MDKVELNKEQIVALHRAACQDDLSEFLKASMPIVMSNDKYLHDWYMDAICEFLTEVYKGNIKRGMINMPPRVGKSKLCSQIFPAWILGKDPKKQIFCATYSSKLSDDMSNSCRALMKSELYRSIFPNTIISDHQDQKDFFETTAGGCRNSTSFGGTATGFGGNFLIADDPINADDSNSLLEREKCIRWYTGTLLSRLNNKKRDSIFTVMQRLHVDDLAGHLEREGGYEILKLPIYFSKARVVTVGTKTWEVKKDSYLNEKLMGFEEVEKERKDPHTFFSQYMQEPQLAGGNEISVKLINYYDEELRYKDMNIVILVDPANSKNAGSDYTAMMVVGLNHDNNYYLLEIVRDRYNLSERGNKLMDLVRKWKSKGGKMPKVGVEKYGMMVDGEYVKELQKQQNYRFPIVDLGGKTSKEDRIRQIIPDLIDGRWYFPEKNIIRQLDGTVVDLVKELVDREMATFPGGVHPDMLDALARIKDPSITNVLKFPRTSSGDNVDVLGYPRMRLYSGKPVKRHWKDF